MDFFFKVNSLALKEYICERFHFSKHNVYVMVLDWDRECVRVQVSINMYIDVRFNNFLVYSSGYIRELENKEVTARSGLTYIKNPYKPISVALIQKWLMVFSLVKAKRFAEAFTRKVKEELVAKAWAPERVAKWLEAGVNVEDM